MFISPYFIFNGENSEDKFLTIVSTDNEIINDIGIPFSKELSKEEGFDNYTEEDSEVEDVVLNLCLERNGIPLEWTPEIYRSIKDWLCTDDFEEFISFDNPEYVYYFKCTRIQKKFTFNNEGWIEVTFKPLNQYAYKRIKVEKNIKGKEIIDIYNECNFDYYPLISIESTCKENLEIKINDMTITDLNENETIRIDNYMTLVESTQCNSVKALAKCNREWIKLKPGHNQLLVKGECNITVLCEFPCVI